jgi:hypothetical protein
VTIWDDIGEVVDDVTRPMGKAVSDVFDAIPGSEWVKDFTNGPLRDFAKSSVGTVVLRALATTLTGGLASAMGPQLASVAWSMPGLVRGEPFDEAYWKEFSWRAEKTAQAVGTDAAGKALSEMLKRTSDQLMDQAKATFPNLPLDQGLKRLVETTGLTPEKLAAQLGVRPDVAAAALNLILREFKFPTDKYSFETGQPLRVLSSLGSTPHAPYDYTGVVKPTVNCPQWQAAMAMGLSPVVLNALSRKCMDEWQAKATSVSNVRSSLTSLNVARPQSLPPPVFQPPIAQPSYESFKAPPVSAADMAAMERAEANDSPSLPAPSDGAFGSKWPLILGAGLLGVALFINFGKLNHNRA